MPQSRRPLRRVGAAWSSALFDLACGAVLDGRSSTQLIGGQRAVPEPDRQGGLEIVQQ